MTNKGEHRSVVVGIVFYFESEKWKTSIFNLKNAFKKLEFLAYCEETFLEKDWLNDLEVDLCLDWDWDSYLLILVFPEGVYSLKQ